MEHRILELLTSMGRGQEQPPSAIRAFVEELVAGRVTRPQAAAWLAWAFARRLTEAETLALTEAMTQTGTVLSWEAGEPLWDKHSTGGVGDKVSLILAPLWACLGRRVPMLSGRGLGHTGGTLDKLEAIPGFRTDLPVEQLRSILADVGCFISGQTAELAPADRVLYALRNETCTVPSLPLIVGSILSKKLAAGVRHLVLDVKCGNGAFMETPEAALELARALVRVGQGAGLQAQALVTAMDRPLGRAVGNALEVEEAWSCLKGEGPSDLRELVLELAGDPRAPEWLASGRAAERFAQMIRAQGGDPDAPLRGAGVEEASVRAPRSGFVSALHAGEIGRAAFALGAGRSAAEEPVDPGVGVVLQVGLGDEVRQGQELIRVYHRHGRGLEKALQRLNQACQVGDGPANALPVVLARC